MPQYVIEREIPGAGDLTPAQLKDIAQTSSAVLEKMGPEIKWEQSYVTGNKIYCVYTAPNAEMVKEHARQGGFPADVVSEVSAVISPATAQ
ncbi:membrane protein [Pontibacter sp. HJ8]